MSDLEISMQRAHLMPPDEACHEPPPSGELVDPCYVTIPLHDSNSPAGSSRQITFNRHGDRFILSPTNTQSDRDWYEGHGNTQKIERTLRLAGGIIQSPHLTQSIGSYRFFLVLAQFVNTGDVRVPGIAIGKADRYHLAKGLLSTFTDTPKDATSALLGRLTLMKASSWLSRDKLAIDRIEWISSTVLPLVPRYRAFRSSFISQKDISSLSDQDTTRLEQFREVAAFSRQVVVQRALNLPLRFDQVTTRAMRAYQEFYADEIASGDRPDFCDALSEALSSLGERPGFGKSLVEKCEGIRELLDESPGLAASNSMPAFLETRAGQEDLQRMIVEESDDANMPIRWFNPQDGDPRPSYRQVTEAFFGHVNVETPLDEESGEIEVTFDFHGFRTQMDLLISSNLTTKREYVLMGLAVLRKYFGEDGAPPATRIFWNDEYQEVNWQISDPQLREVRRYLDQLGGMRETSETFSESTMPWLEGGAAVLGLAGLLVSQLVPKVRDSDTARLAIGVPSAGLLSGGSLALGMHYGGQPLIGYKNRPLWEGFTFGIGFLGGAGLMLGLELPLGDDGGSSMSPMDDPGMRNPVDTFGP